MGPRARDTLDLLDRFADDFPDAAKVFFGREQISQPETHYDAASQFRLHQIGFTSRVDRLDDLGVLSIRFGVIGALESKTDHAHDDRRGQFKAIVLLYPGSEQLGQPQVIPNAGGETSASKRPENHPCL